MAETEKITLSIEFSFNPASGLFNARLENGTQFSVAPIHVSGKLGANLDLLRQFTMRDKAGVAPQPHIAAAKDFGATAEARLIEEAIAAGKVKKFSASGREELSLEMLGL